MSNRQDCKLVEVEPGRWRMRRPIMQVARSKLAFPMVISDEMDPVEQVDGRLYTSKAKFRAVGRAHGLVEIGNDPARFKPMRRNHSTKAERRRSLEKAIAQYKAGRRV